MATNARPNLRAMALVFAAVESAGTGESVRVQEFLDDHRAAVSAADCPGRRAARYTDRADG